LKFIGKSPPLQQAGQTLGNMLKEPTHIQAHLVFANTQSPNKKPKELDFLPTLD
jgi:hypothetical protein